MLETGQLRDWGFLTVEGINSCFGKPVFRLEFFKKSYIDGIKASNVIFAVNLKNEQEIVEERNEWIKEMRITD